MELLEREAHLGALAEYAASAADGHGRLVLLSGDAGIGKTSLVDAFRDEHPGFAWLWGACDASFTPRPLGPLFEIATAAGGELAERARTGGGRNELFAASVAHLASAQRPVVVVVEDLHWADEATLDWLSYLARRVGGTRALVVVTYRHTEAAADPVLTAVIGRIATHGSTRRMLLPPLTAAATGRLASQQGLDPERVFRVSGGNPFYVREVLADPERDVPDSVADVVRARVARHTPPAQRLLAAAAVIGRPAPAPVVAAVAGVPAGAIDECLSTGTLVVDDGRYAFAHELTRLAVERDLRSYHATELHQAAFAVLAREGADHAELAHHAERAGDTAAAFAHARAAAADALRFHSHREAAVQLERALRGADRAGADEATRAELLDRLTRVHGLMDHWEAAIATNVEAVRVRRRLGDRKALCASLEHRVLCLWRLCRSREAVAAATELVKLTKDLPTTSERGWALAYRCGLGPVGVELQARIAEAEEAIRIGEQLGEGELVAHAMQTRGALRALRGEEGLPEIERALRIARGTGSVSQTARAFANLYELAVAELRMDEFEWVWAEGQRWCEDHEMRTWSLCLAAARAQALLRRGGLRDASLLAGKVLRQPISQVNRAHLNIPYLTSRVRLGDGDLHAELDAARRLAAGSGDACWRIPIETAVCELAWLRDDPTIVDDHVFRVYDETAGSEPWLRSELAVGLSRLGLLREPPVDPPSPYREELTGDHPASAAAWRQRGCPYEAAQAQAASGEPALLQEALVAFTALGAEPAATRVRRLLRGAGLRSGVRGPRRTTLSHPAGLTAREAEVLTHLAAGLTNPQIADVLVLSTRTVDHHVSAVLAKLGVDSRADAARRAAELAATT